MNEHHSYRRSILTLFHFLFSFRLLLHIDDPCNGWNFSDTPGNCPLHCRPFSPRLDLQTTTLYRHRRNLHNRCSLLYRLPGYPTHLLPRPVLRWQGKEFLKCTKIQSDTNSNRPKQVKLSHSCSENSQKTSDILIIIRPLRPIVKITTLLLCPINGGSTLRVAPKE